MAEWKLNIDPATVRVLISGYQSWSEAELRPLTDRQAVPLMQWRHEQGHDPAFLPSGEAGVWRSHSVLALVRPDGGGWVGAARDATHSFIHWEARAEGQTVRVSGTVEGPAVELTWDETGDVIGTLERRAAELGQNMHARTPAPQRVWCSWYSYYRDVTLDAMLENARLAREHGLPFDVFQLDDGFQADLGDWFTASDHFGGHARDLPAELNELGFTAGLWLAPFLASPTSQLFRDHPDWMLRGKDDLPLAVGHNWGGAYHALDTTHPEVLAWLRELAATARGWGYPYLKLDFLYGAALPGCGMTRRWAVPRRTATGCRRCATVRARTPSCWAAAHRLPAASGSWTPCAPGRTWPRCGTRTRAVSGWATPPAPAPATRCTPRCRAGISIPGISQTRTWRSAAES
ncbi:glycoside hydrolase family 36 protein [Deinococcus radiopugnans]|uniref:glycoside hydrolase family 36 protein n=1 Tax=Deinococcus radiopugnans TaxID=57497 RepID=UPI0036241CD5